MLVKINGESREVADGIAVTDLLAQLGLAPQRVAIELNQKVISRKDWAGAALHEGDRVEIVHFVGGGSAV